MMVIYNDDCIIAIKDPDLIKEVLQEISRENSRSWTKEKWMNTLVSRLNTGVMAASNFHRANSNHIRN